MSVKNPKTAYHCYQDLIQDQCYDNAKCTRFKKKWALNSQAVRLSPFPRHGESRSRARPSTHRARPLEVAHCIRDASHLPGTPTARSCSREDQPYDLLLPGCLPFARVEAADQRQKIKSSTLRSLGPVDSLDLFYMYKNSARGHIPDRVTMLWP